MKAYVYRELISDARSLVAKKEYKKAAETIVAPIYALYSHTINPSLRNVYLSGVSRVGKTSLANMLSKRGYLIISMDDIREFYWCSSTAYLGIEDIDACRKAVYQVLDSYFPSGVCIEGSDIYFHTLSRGQSLPGNHVHFVLGINKSAILKKAVSMYSTAKRGYCRGLMTFTEALRIAAIQSMTQDDLLKLKSVSYYYLDMMQHFDLVHSIRTAEEEVIDILKLCDCSEIKNYVQIDFKRMDEKTYQNRLKSINLAHEKEKNELLLHVELLLRENELLKNKLLNKEVLAYSIFNHNKKESSETEKCFSFDFSLPIDHSD